VEAGQMLGNFEVARFNADGSPDMSFGYHGRLITDLGGNDTPADIVLQPNGDIILFGASDNRFCVARYLPDGQLDNTFGSGGITTTDPTAGAGGTATVAGIALRPDGKLVAAGVANNSIALIRYDADGSPDTGFGAGGLALTPLAPVNSGLTLRDLALQSNGDIVAVGNSIVMGPHSSPFSFTRVFQFTADGAVDGTFDTPPFTINGVFYATAIQSDGKIVAVGNKINNVLIARYNTDGSLDTTFAGSVPSLTDVAPDTYEGVYIQSDGRIVAGGHAFQVSTSTDVLVLNRYNSDGTLDASFGTAGQTITPFAGGDRGFKLGQGPGGTTVAASGFDSALDIARYTGDGTVTPPPPPPGTSISGTVFNDANGNGVRDPGEAGVAGQVVYLDRQGINQIVAGDSVDITADDGAYTFKGLAPANYIVRTLTQPGQTHTAPPPQFGGFYWIPYGSGPTITGKDFGLRTAPVVPVGTSISGSVYYDTNGNAVRDSGEPAVPGRKVYLDLQGLGHQVPADPVATTDSNGNYSFTGLPSANYIVRADDNSVLTAPLFGGFHWVPFSSGPVVSGQDFGVQSVGSSNVRLPDGKVAVEAFAAGVGPSRFTGVTRFNADNSGDQTFGIGGDVPINTGAGTEGGAAQIARLPNGNLLAIFFTPGGPFTALISPSGTLLGSTYASPGTFGSQGVAVQPDNKFLIPSVTVGGSVILHRFNPDLTLDTTFGLGGSVTLPVSGVTRPRIFTVLPDGTIQITYDSGTFLISPNGTLQ
jgi:uncharacterized delta-60 repeat protein